MASGRSSASSRAKQSQFSGMGRNRRGATGRPRRRRWGPACETKPIPARATSGTSALWTKGYDEFGVCKAMAKQSQFPSPGRLAREATILSCQGSTAAPGAQTKPIGAVAPNKANRGDDPLYKQTQFAHPAPPRGADGQGHGETKPISVRQTDSMDLESATVCRAHPTLCGRKEKVAAAAVVAYNPAFGLEILKGIRG